MSLKRLCFIICLAVLLLDQASKLLVDQLLALGQSHPLLPLLDVTLAYNRGAAFSFLSTAGGWQRWFFAALALIVSILIAHWIIKLPAEEKYTGVSLALVLGGAIGNLIDRVSYGYVIDFIDFYYPSTTTCLPLFNRLSSTGCHFATFNIADSAISVGATMLILSSLLEAWKSRNHRPISGKE